jgi:hypothetical protein
MRLIDAQRLQSEILQAESKLNKLLASASSNGMAVEIIIDEVTLMGARNSQKVVSTICTMRPNQIQP